jgi:uncharacterized protein YggT (Ycf19 family)
MALIDFILNVAGLLLWFTWRSSRVDPLARTTPSTLVGTLRRAEPSKLTRWQFPALLAGLVVLRALFYWQVGSAMNWTPRLDFGVVALAFPFRGNYFLPVLLYSLLSLLDAFVIYYFWLLALVVINRRSASPNPFQKMLLVQLGRPARWPWPIQLLLPLIVITPLWMIFHPLLVHAGITVRTRSIGHLAEQGLLVGTGIYFSLKYLLPAILFVHLVASYIYLGESPFWEFVATTTRNILAPLGWLRLRFARFDFAPLAGIVLILLLLHALPAFVQYLLSRNHLVIWPE